MIYRLFVQKNNIWHELDLPSDFNLSLVLNSGFLGSKQSGSFSFSAQIPTTLNNCTVLQNAQNPQVVVNRHIELPAKLLHGSTELYSWYFILRNAADTHYKYDLRQTPGNQPKNFYERKLWQLDFGKMDLVSIQRNSNVWAIDLYGASKLAQYFISPMPVYFEIWINGVFVVSPPTGQTSVGNDVEYYFFTETDPETRFISVAKNVRNYAISLDIPTRGKGSINVISRGQIINRIKIKIYQYSRLSAIAKGAFVAEYDLENLTYNDVSESINTVATDQYLHPFKFLPYFNDSFYPSDNAQYEGIVNQYDGALLKLNDATINALNTYPISPCFSIVFMLQKIVAMMGFYLDAKIFTDTTQDDYLGDLYLINNVDFAKQLVGTTHPVNVYPDSIVYADFMPDMTTKEFLDAVRTTFCLSIEYDYRNATLIVEKCKKTLQSNDVINISDTLSRAPEAQVLDKTYYQLAFKNVDNNIVSQYSYPTDSSIVEDGNTYTKIEAGFSPTLNNFDIDPFLTIDDNPNIPTVTETARSIIYPDQKANRPSPKMCFFLGLDDSKKPKSDNKNKHLCLSFASSESHKGLVEAFYTEYLEFLNATTQWSAEIYLSELELANFRFAQKYYAYGTVFLPETISLKLPIKDIMKITLLSL